MDSPVAPWEAALGSQVRVPTLDGPVEVSVPPNTQTGQRLRLRGQGMSRKDRGRGDQYVRIQICEPSVTVANGTRPVSEIGVRIAF